MAEEQDQSAFTKLARQAWLEGYFGRLSERGYGHLRENPELALKATEKQAAMRDQARSQIEPQIKQASTDILRRFVESD